jgi:hypothetical protein
MEADHSSEDSKASYSIQSFSVAEVTKLIIHPLNGDVKKLENSLRMWMLHSISYIQANMRYY